MVLNNGDRQCTKSTITDRLTLEKQEIDVTSMSCFCLDVLSVCTSTFLSGLQDFFFFRSPSVWPFCFYFASVSSAVLTFCLYLSSSLCPHSNPFFAATSSSVSACLYRSIRLSITVEKYDLYKLSVHRVAVSHHLFPLESLYQGFQHHVYPPQRQVEALGPLQSDPHNVHVTRGN